MLKKVFFRVDANEDIGLGHLIRSLSIAEIVKNTGQNVEVLFLTTENSIAEKEIIRKNFGVILMPQSQQEETFLLENSENADILFIDKLYKYSSAFIKALKKNTKIVMFHNICEGGYSSDIFILPSAHTDESIINNDLWEQNNVLLYHGLDYIVINEQIQNIKKKRNSDKNKNLKIVITTGGSDPKGVIFNIYEWIRNDFFSEYNFVFLIGQAFKHIDQLEKLKEKLPQNLRITPFSPNEYIDADIAISTFGVTTYELLYLNIPVLSIGHAQKNAEGSFLLQERTKAIVDLGLIDNLESKSFLEKLGSLLVSDEIRNGLSKKNKNLIDGNGTYRIARIILDAI